MKRSIEASPLCVGKAGVGADCQGATEENNLTSAEQAKALNIISLLQKNSGQDVTDLTEDDLLLLADFKRRFGLAKFGPPHANSVSRDSFNGRIC